MSLLTLIQNVATEVGISSPSSVIGNNDTQIQQLLQLAQQEGRLLASRGRWSALTKGAAFTLSLAADQGKLQNGGTAVVSDGDFDYMTNDTMWNDTTTLPILGPVSSRQWQTLQVFPVTGPYQQFMIRGNNLFIDPVPTSADTVVFDYQSTWWCEDSGGQGQDSWQDDSDVGRLDEKLMRLGILWRWLRRKGQDYSEEFAEYERQVLDALARDGGNEVMNLSTTHTRHREAGIVVPIGSWNP